MNRAAFAMPAEEAATGWTASSRTTLDRTFRAAARHSRRVRILRVAVPAAVVVGIGALVLATWLNPSRLLAKLPTGAALAISGTKITMDLPRLEGFTRDSRPYVLTAKSAAQDLLHPDSMELNDIHAKMETPDKATVEMSAATGLYHSKADQLILRDRIVLRSSSGYEGHLTEAVVDMSTGHIVSDKPVEVKLLNGVLTANHLEVAGELIRFDGGVTLDLEGGSFSTPRASAAQ